MKTLVQSIEIPPTMPMNPFGEYTHLLRLSFKHEDEGDQGFRLPSIYCLYCRKDNTLSQITEEGVAEVCIAAAFKGAEISRPGNQSELLEALKTARSVLGTLLQSDSGTYINAQTQINEAIANADGSH